MADGVAIETSPTAQDIPPALLQSRRELSKAVRIDPLTSREQEAQAKRAQMWRTPQMQVLLSLVRHDPEIWNEVQPVLARAKEIRTTGVTPLIGKSDQLLEAIDANLLEEPNKLDPSAFLERHRDFAPLGASLILSEQAAPVFDYALDQVIAAESDMHRERIAAGEEAYAHTIVQGAGVAGINLQTEMFAVNPHNAPMVYDTATTAGGVFAIPKGGSWFLNSRARPTGDPELPNLPGTEASLNTAGRHAALQEADVVSSGAYNEQYGYAMALKYSAAMSMPMMMQQRLVEFRPNRTKGAYKGAMLAVSEHTPTGEQSIQGSDRFINCGGLGPEKSVLQDTSQLQTIKEQALKEFEEGGDPRYLTYLQYMQRVADRDIRMPHRSYKNVGVLGASDGGRTVVAKLLQEKIKGTSINMDWVEKVYWFGQSARTKKEFLAKERTRYAALGLEFPRDDEFDEYFSRIVPLGGPGFRARRLLQEPNGNLTVVFTRPTRVDSDGKAIPEADGTIQTVEDSVSVDHFIEAAGYESEDMKKALQPLFNEYIEDRNEITQRLPQALQQVGTKVTLADDTVYELVAVDVNSQTGSIRGRIKVVRVDGAEAEFTNPLDGGALDTLAEAFIASNIKSLEIQGEVPEPELIYDPDNPAIPIAKRYPGQYDLYVVGTAAGIPVTQEELAAAPPLARATENVVAAFLNGPKAQKLGKMLAEQDRQAGITDGGIDSFHKPADEIVTLPPLVAGAPAQPLALRINKNTERRAFGSRFVEKHFMQFSVGSTLYGYDFPEGLDQLTFTIERIPDAEAENLAPGQSEYRIMSNPPLPQDVAYNKMMVDLFGTPIMERVMTQGTKMSASGLFEIRVPISDQLVDVANIDWGEVKIPARQKKARAAMDRRRMQPVLTQGGTTGTTANSRGSVAVVEREDDNDENSASTVQSPSTLPFRERNVRPTRPPRPQRPRRTLEQQARVLAQKPLRPGETQQQRDEEVEQLRSGNLRRTNPRPERPPRPPRQSRPQTRPFGADAELQVIREPAEEEVGVDTTSGVKLKVTDLNSVSSGAPSQFDKNTTSSSTSDTNGEEQTNSQ